MYDKNSVLPFDALVGEFPSQIPRKKNPGYFFILRQLHLTQREASFPKTTFVVSKPFQYESKDKKSGKTTETKEPLSANSIKNIHCILSKSLNTAIGVGYLKTNNAERTKLPKIVKKEIKPLTDEQVRSFLIELEQEEYADQYRIIIFTGLR